MDAAKLLSWDFSRMDMFVSIIGAATWDWRTPEVRKALKVVLAVEPEEMREALQRNTVAMLEFTTEAYRRLYR